MKILRLFSLLLCLSACQATQQYPLPVDPPTNPGNFLPLEPLPALDSGHPPLNQQELTFSQPRNKHLLPLNEDGNGLLIGGAAQSSEPLGIHRVNNFVVQKETALTYPDLFGTQAADYTAFINEAGQGQVIVVNTASSIPPSAVTPAISRPPDNGPLEIRTVTVSDFKPAAEPELIAFTDRFSNIKLGQTLVDENGNGFLSLRVIDPVEGSSNAGGFIPLPIDPLDPAPDPPPTNLPSTSPVSRWVFIPIRSHRVQSTLVSAPDMSGISGELVGVWLNANQDGLILYRQEPQHWFVRSIHEGKLSDQPIDLGKVLNISNPRVDIDATGNGYIHFIQADRLHKLCTINRFIVREPQALSLPPLPAEHYVVSYFKNGEGSVIEVPRTPLQGDTWAFKVHRLYLGNVLESLTFTHTIDSIRIPGGGMSLSLTARGDGLFAWSTLQKGGINGKIHLKAFERFLPAGADHWP
jgi:hypothetical protein